MTYTVKCITAANDSNERFKMYLETPVGDKSYILDRDEVRYLFNHAGRALNSEVHE